MLLSFFTITNSQVSQLLQQAGEVFTDFEPILIVVLAVLIGFFIVSGLLQLVLFRSKVNFDDDDDDF